MSDIEARVKKIIAEQLGVEEGQVTNEKAFVADLGADSLDLVSLTMAFEEAFDLRIPDEQAEGCTTVADALALLDRQNQIRPVQSVALAG